MANYKFQQATKEQAKLRLAIFGPSGAGKTFTALRLAKGIAEELDNKIGFIDTEFGTASKYSDRFSFMTLNLLDPKVSNMIDAIKSASEFDVLIIDSLSHSWKELLQEVDKLAKSKYRGNTWSAWSEGTPMQSEMVTAIQRFPGHLIATMRTKTEWLTTDNGGKTVPVRVGLAPEQGKGIEYEFDMLMEISPDHIVNVIKDRSGKFQDRTVDKPGEEFGKEILSWLSEGVEPVILRTKDDLIAEGAKLGLTPTEIGSALKADGLQFDPHQWEEMIKSITVFANGRVEYIVE
jgi:hypothetical protein